MSDHQKELHAIAARDADAYAEVARTAMHEAIDQVVDELINGWG